jgi:hypothetical protein
LIATYPKLAMAEPRPVPGRYPQKLPNIQQFARCTPSADLIVAFTLTLTGSKSKKKSAAPAYKPDAFKQLDMDVLAPLKDGEDLPEVEAYPTFDPTNGYFVEERSKDSKR